MRAGAIDRRGGHLLSVACLGWEAGPTTRAETRYGCFLPDLTGLARRPSIANLPGALYRRSEALGQPLANHWSTTAAGPLWRRRFGGFRCGIDGSGGIADQRLADLRAVAADLRR